MGVLRGGSYGRDILIAAIAPASVGLALVLISRKSPWADIGLATIALALGVALGRSANAVVGVILLVLAAVTAGSLVHVDPSSAAGPLDLAVASLCEDAISIAFALGILGVACGALLRRRASEGT